MPELSDQNACQTHLGYAHLGYFACYLKKLKKGCDVIVDAPELSHRDGLPRQLARLVHRVLKKRDNHIS